MNILLTFDNNYSSHAGVVIASFVSNNVGSHNFYIVSDYISEDNKRKLKECAPTSHFYYIGIDKHLAEMFPMGKRMANHYVSVAAYYRLFALSLLPASIERILYVDSDIVFRGNASALYNTPRLQDYCLLALEESSTMALAGCQRLGYPNSFSYFNSGVLLLNMHEIRKEYYFGQAVNYATSHTIIFHDQDILNGLFHDKKAFFPLKYNVLDSFLICHAQLPQRYENQKEDLLNPVIVHFSGPLKPWYQECNNPYRCLYEKYLSMTPWRGEKPIVKYQTIKAKSAYLSKLFIKAILERLNLRYYHFIKISTRKSW